MTAVIQKGHRVLVVLLAALSMLGALCIDAYLPSLPTIAREFGASPAAAQQTMTVYLACFAFMMLFYGTLSDSFGRRPVLLASMWLYVAGAVGAVFAPSLGWLLFFRAVQGLSAGAGSTVGRAVVGDLLRGAEAQRTMAVISMVFGIAPAIAPIVGGWLEAASGWRAVFVFIALCGALLLAACLRWLPESLPAAERHPFRLSAILASYREVGTHARFLCKALGAAFGFSGVMLYVGSAPAFAMGILHLPVTAFAWLFVPLIGGMTLGSAGAAKLSHRVAPRAMIAAGFAVMAAGAAANVLYAWLCVSAVPWAVVPLFVYAFGMALGNPAMTLLALDFFPRIRGMAASLQGFTFMATFAVVSGVVCPLLFGSALHLALGLAGGLALSVAFWTLGTRVLPKNA